MNHILPHCIVFEGLDGAGTTTQLRLLTEYYEKLHTPCYPTAEPTDEPIGRLIRSALRKEFQVEPWSLALLYAADRTNHVKTLEAESKAGKICISDRYFFSSLAYQGVTCPYEDVWALNANFPYPEYLFYIDTPVSACMERIDTRGQKKELFEKESYLKQVEANYKKAFSTLPSGVHFYQIDGTASKEKVFEAVKNALAI